MEDFDFPPQCIPVKFFDGLGPRVDRQVCDQLPVDAFAILRRVSFLRMDDREVNGRPGTPGFRTAKRLA